MKRTRNTDKKHQQILQAALQVFSGYGYAGAGMDMIAEAANASKRTVYNHFSSKKELYLELAGQFVDMVSRAKDIEYDPAVPLQLQLEDIIRHELNILEDPTLLKFAFTIYTYVHTDPTIAGEIEGTYSKRQKTLERWLRAAKEDRGLKVPDVRRSTMLLWEIVDGVILVPSMQMGSSDRDEVSYRVREISAMFLARFIP